MKKLVKLLSFYPVALIGGILLLVARGFGWVCLFAFLLVGGFKLVGALDVSGWIVASLLAGGAMTLIIADLLVRLMSRGFGPDNI